MIAEIHHKSPLTTSEDFLTADVFSAFRYLPVTEGLIGWLHLNPDLAKNIPVPQESAAAVYHFWSLGNTREPDVLIELIIDEVTYHIVVEAKYLSGPSDGEIIAADGDDETVMMGNQLADQLRDLDIGHYTIWQGGTRRTRKLLSSEPAHRLLIYLTAHPLRPKAELNRSQQLYPTGADRLFWMSWYHVDDYLRSNFTKFSEFPYRNIVSDLLLLLGMKGFASFRGVTRPIVANVPPGAFWQDRRQPLPVFNGIVHPPVLQLPTNGRFFRGTTSGAAHE
jgi:hypothetical protein